ncbi:MAG: methyltransferase [Pseudomonadota bacterium]
MASALTAAGIGPAQPGAVSDMAIVWTDRHRDVARADVAAAFESVRPGGTVILDGAKAHGIDSLIKRLKPLVAPDGTAAKSHGKVAWFSRPTRLASTFSDWTATVAPRRNADGFLTQSGLFSPDRIDPGTQLLAEAIAGPLTGRIADLGAGWGGLSALLLARGAAPERLDLLETDARALALARRNIDHPAAAFHWADATQPKTKEIYDLVVANPPFHESRSANPTLGRAFIAAAAAILRPKGVFWMVANRHLAYEAAMTEHFRHWDEHPGSPQFKIFRAERPGSRRRR